MNNTETQEEAMSDRVEREEEKVTHSSNRRIEARTDSLTTHKKNHAETKGLQVSKGSGRRRCPPGYPPLPIPHKQKHLCFHTSTDLSYTRTFDGVDDLVQVLGVVAVWPTARAYLQ